MLDMKEWTEEHFEHYYKGTMEPSLKIEFEQDLTADIELFRSYNAHVNLMDLLQKSWSRKVLKKKLKTVHLEMLSSQELNEQLGKRYRIYIRRSLAVAAGAAVLVSFMGLYFSDRLGFNRNDAYMQLRNEVQDIYSTQENIKKELSKNKNQPAAYTGTSFAVSCNGILATNYHVIKDLDSVWVTNFQDTFVRYSAQIIYKNAATDIALLKITDSAFKGFGKLPYNVPTHYAEIGEYVYTLGYSKQEIVFGEGSISSVSGYHNDTSSYQVSIPVNPGNSGGPVFDSNGNFLGMISGKNTTKDGVGFAIKSDHIYLAIKEISNLETSEQPVMQYRNKLAGKKRTEQVKVLQPLVFKVQIAF
jgi:serine protease Do